MSGNKGQLLEKKVISLERRLALVERFVELRYCETFRDFAIRNSDKNQESDDDDDDDDNQPALNDRGGGNGEDMQEEEGSIFKSLTSRSTKRTTTVKKSSGRPNSSQCKQGKESSTKDCVVRVVRIKEKQKQQAAASVQSTSGTRNPYGTRRQTRMSAQVKIENEEENINIGGEADCSSDNDDYFTFPVDQQNPNEGSEVGDDQEESHLDTELGDNASWNGSDGDGNNEEDSEEDYGKRIKLKERQTAKATPQSGKRKRRVPQASVKNTSRKRSNHHLYYASLADLSKETKILSNDTSREECPICKRHYKKELIEQHISSHTKERHMQCPHCDKRYFSGNDLRNHIKITHDREKHFPKCRQCDQPIVRKMILHEKYCVKRALKNGQAVDENLLENVKQQCTAAGLEFSLSDLDESFPPGVDPSEKLECPHCKRFFQRRNYDRHVKSHSLSRNWKCSKCPKAYIHKHDLIRHMCVTHEVSLECARCKESFETRMELWNHNLKCKKSKTLSRECVVKSQSPPESKKLASADADGDNVVDVTTNTSENDTQEVQCEADVVVEIGNAKDASDERASAE